MELQLSLSRYHRQHDKIVVLGDGSLSIGASPPFKQWDFLVRKSVVARVRLYVVSAINCAG
jgi:hypothetical protein